MYKIVCNETRFDYVSAQVANKKAIVLAKTENKNVEVFKIRSDGTPVLLATIVPRIEVDTVFGTDAPFV